MNGLGFLAHVEQFLTRALRPGDVFIIDVLNSRKVTGVREAVEAAGAELLYPPPCSPDPNPVGRAFASCVPLHLAQVGSGVRPTLDHPYGFQYGDRLAHRTAPDAEALDQLAFGGQAIGS